ncbi:MAG TPA: DUF308 domain-containing protein [Longimicrobiales bacterium]
MAARRERVPGEPQREEPRRVEPARVPRRGPAAGAYVAPVPWWVVLLQGIVGVLVGLALLLTPAAATVALVQLVGLYWFVAGIFALVRIFLPSRRVGWGWLLLGGVLGIVAGLVVLQHPLWSAVVVPTVLVLYLGAYGIVIGLIHLAEAARGGGWGIGVLGVLGIVVGALLLLSPLAAALALPWVLGILALAGGILAIVGSFSIRRAEAGR